MGQRLRTIVSVVIICIIVLVNFSTSVLAIEPHRDPEAARPVYSAIALLRYYANSLDLILQRNAVEVEARLEKMPFANIAQELDQATADFTTSGIGLSHLVVDVADDVATWQTLIAQSRFNEANKLAEQALARVERERAVILDSIPVGVA